MTEHAHRLGAARARRLPMSDKEVAALVEFGFDTGELRGAA